MHPMQRDGIYIQTKAIIKSRTPLACCLLSWSTEAVTIIKTDKWASTQQENREANETR